MFKNEYYTELLKSLQQIRRPLKQAHINHVREVLVRCLIEYIINFRFYSEFHDPVTIHHSKIVCSHLMCGVLAYDIFTLEMYLVQSILVLTQTKCTYDAHEMRSIPECISHEVYELL